VVRKNATFFNPDLFLIVATTLLISFLAISNNWVGKDVMQIFIIELVVVGIFALIKYLMHPKRTVTEKVVIVFLSCFFTIPLVTLFLIILAMVYDLDIVTAGGAKLLELSDTSQWQLLYLLPVWYTQYLFVVYFLPAIAVIFRYIWLTYKEFKLQHSSFFSEHSAVGFRGVQVRLVVLMVPMFVATLLPHPGSGIVSDQVVLWTFILMYFLAGVVIHLAQWSSSQRS